MLIPISKIIVRDRIRKDFGDIEGLADSINKYGLINNPVVNKDYVLLAGERRIRACKLLGWEQIPVNMMDTRDAEHELNIEISENDDRKEFSKAERVDYMRRLWRIEQAKAAERQRAALKQNADTDREMFPERETGRAKDKTAAAFGISGKTMEKEMQIVDNKDLLTPEDFADWDEGRLSTNKAFQKVKAMLKAAEEEARNKSDLLEEFDGRLKQYEEANKKLREDNRTLANRVKPETVYLEPEDYQEVKNSLDKAEDTIEQRDAEIASLKQQLREASNEGNTDFSQTLYEYAVDDMATFISRYSDLPELSAVIDVMKETMA